MSLTAGPGGRDQRVAVVSGAPRGRLGEGPVWHPRAERLAYVDVVEGLVHVLDVEGTSATLDRTVSIGGPVGAVAPDGDGWVLAVENGFERRDADWQVVWRDEVFAADGVIRFNDAAVDDHGRFFAGTLAYDEESGQGALYRLDPDGSHRVVVPRVGISNGIGWSPDGRTMYLTDSLAGVVYAYAYDAESGDLGERQDFYHHADEAAPDGLTVDAAGGVWIALWDGGRVLRLDPSGVVTDVVPMGVPRPTSLAFGGPGLARLYVTSAWDRLSTEQVEAAPDSGLLLSFVPPVPGQAGAL